MKKQLLTKKKTKQNKLFKKIKQSMGEKEDRDTRIYKRQANC